MRHLSDSVVRVLALVLVGLGVSCDEGSSPAPTSPAPPPPPPLQSLEWLDLPEGSVTVEVGQETTVSLRISAAVEATYSATAGNDNAGATIETVRAGVVRVRITGRAAGESSIDLVATAPGYQTAEAALDVEIEEPIRSGYITSSIWGCRQFDVMQESLELVLFQGEDSAVDFLFDKIIAGECVLFDPGDPLTWRGTERFLPADWGLPIAHRSVIQVAMTPSGATPGLWWVPRNNTSFGSVSSSLSPLESAARRAGERVPQH